MRVNVYVCMYIQYVVIYTFTYVYLSMFAYNIRLVELHTYTTYIHTISI